MKICKNCGKEFSPITKIDGKRLNSAKRKYCLECNPKNEHRFWGGKETNKTKGVDRNDKVEYTCKNCGRLHSNKTRNLECSTCSTRKKRHERKELAYKLKGNKCVICGYNKCFDALAFHHIDETLKKFTLACSWGLSWKEIEKELENCVLLCCRCHAEVHNGMTKL